MSVLVKCLAKCQSTEGTDNCPQIQVLSGLCPHWAPVSGPFMYSPPVQGTGQATEVRHSFCYQEAQGQVGVGRSV